MDGIVDDVEHDDVEHDVDGVVQDVDGIEHDDAEHDMVNEEIQGDSEDDENDVEDLLQKVTLIDEGDDVGNDVGNDEVNDLLNSIENENNEETDYSKLSREVLLAKTNTQLKTYLKNVNKSTSGNKNTLVDTILN